MMKSLNFILLILFITFQSFAGIPPAGRATGFFLGVGVGPRIPVSEFAQRSNIGYGINAEISYTDNSFLPVFLFLNTGYEQYPGSQSYFKENEYSNININSVPVNAGIRYYFPPIIESIFLLMPMVQASANYTHTNTLYEFDESLNKKSIIENKNEFGFSAGIGVSAFMMELLTSYNYLPEKQFISVDLKVRFPLYINF